MQEGCYFAIRPIALTLLQAPAETSLPFFSFTLFRGHARIDTSTHHPTSPIQVSDQEIYYPLTPAILRFSEPQGCQWELVRVEVHDQRKLIGIFYLDSMELVKEAWDTGRATLKQQVRISGGYLLQMEVVVGETSSQLDSVLAQFSSDQSLLKLPPLSMTNSRADTQSGVKEVTSELLDSKGPVARGKKSLEKQMSAKNNNRVTGLLWLLVGGYVTYLCMLPASKV